MKVEPNQRLDAITLTWFCDHCGLPVENGDGHIEVSRTAARDAQAAWAAGKRAHTDEHGWETWDTRDLMAMPEPVRWQVWHAKCDPDPDGDADPYWIAIERVRNLAQLLDLHGHMGEKNWTKYTDFDDIRRHLPGLYGVC